MNDCWNFYARDRPSFTEIELRLKKIIQKIKHNRRKKHREYRRKQRELMQKKKRKRISKRTKTTTSRYSPIE